MSEDEREIDIESEDEDGNSRSGRHGSGGDNPSTDKRAHHNALERKRRDHIKDSFSSLRDAIPTMQVKGDKSSRAQILKKASDYITFMRRKNQSHQQDIEDLKRQNTHLEKQIRTLERAKSSGNYSSAAEVLSENGLLEDASSLVTPRPHSDMEFSASAYEDGSDTSEGSTGTGNLSGGATALAPLPVTRIVTATNGVAGARVIAPGQSLLLTTASGNAPITLAESQPPARKKLKT
jgi:Max protein